MKKSDPGSGSNSYDTFVTNASSFLAEEDMIGEEIKGLDLQFYYKEKWQSLGDTEMIDFQICKNYCVGTRLVGYGRVKQK